MKGKKKKNIKLKFKRKTKHKKRNKIHKRKTKKKQRGGSLNQSVEVESSFNCDVPEYFPKLCLSHRIFKDMRKVNDNDRVMDNRDVKNKGYCMGNPTGGRIFADMIEEERYQEYFGDHSEERLGKYKCPMLYTNIVELVPIEDVRSNHSIGCWHNAKRNSIKHEGKFYMFYCPYHLSHYMTGGLTNHEDTLQIRDTFDQQIEKVEHCKDYDPIRHPDIDAYIKDNENCPPIIPLDTSTTRTTCVPRDTGCIIS